MQLQEPWASKLMLEECEVIFHFVLLSLDVLLKTEAARLRRETIWGPGTSALFPSPPKRDEE